MRTAAIVGRASETGLVRRWAAADPRPTALVLSGNAGIGKTTLWQAGIAMATERDARVLAARASEGESHLSLVALADLLDGVGSDVTAGLPPPQRHALEVASLSAEPGAEAIDPRTIAAACLGVIRELARTQAVVIAVDDVQWLDRLSLDVLLFVARRLQNERVSFLLTLRAGRPSALVRAFPPEAVEEVEVGGLGLEATRQLLIERIGLSLPRWAMTRLFEATGGNPLFALEVGRRLDADGIPASDDPFPVPEDIRMAVGDRVSGLPDGTRDALLAASLLARADLPTVQRAITADIEEALEPAERAEVASIERGLVTFRHPLYAAALIGHATTTQRRRMHRRLADAVAQPEERAWHLSLATRGRDAEVARFVEEGALRARTRGALHAAADLLERARDLTPADDADAARRRGIGAAELHIHAGNRDRARALLERLLRETQPSSDRADALRLLAELHLAEEDLREAERLLVEALPLTTEPERAARIQLELVFLRSLRLDFGTAADDGHEALRRLETTSDGALLAEALAYTALADFLAGRGVDRPAVERALELEEPGRIALPGLSAGAVCGLVMLFDGRHTEAREQLERTRIALIERGDDGDLAHVLLWLSWLELRCGRFVEAERVADDAIASAEITGNSSMRRFAAAQRAYALAHRGELDEARRICAEEAAQLDERSVAQIGLWIASTLTLIELSIGDAEAAWQHCEPLVRSLDPTQPYEPVPLMFLPDGLEALIALGRLDEAEALLDVFERRAGELDRVWARATAARCRALLTAARGDVPGALDALDVALAQHARVEMPFERARTLLVCGIVERRARRRAAARASLEEASSEFERMGARVWGERARAEVTRLGGRGETAPNGLTVTERRVAELAASGRSNKEIAAALFVTVHTVEVHLSRVYAKVGVRSRTQLGNRLGRPHAEHAEP